MPCALTFDLGTTYFKAAVFDARLKMVALARLATPTDSPQPGWGQIDASRFADTIVQLADQLREQAAAAWREVQAISFATQANSIILLDKADLPLRRFPNPQQAARNLEQSVSRLKQLREQGAPKAEVRTAECDWFGAEETLVLAKAAADGRTEKAAQQCLPAEVQVIAVGPWYFVAWQGEVFVEFALEVMAKHPQASIITLAHGELQGYLVTQEAVDEGGYEASNALLASPQSGKQLVAVSLKLLDRLTAGAR